MAVDTVLKGGQASDSSCSRSGNPLGLGFGIENAVSTVLEGGQVFYLSNSRSNNPFDLDSGIVPTIENVVSTVNLGRTLDLKAIAFRAPSTEYKPEKFAGVRMKDSKTTAIIFSSGKMVCSGAKSEKQSLLAASRHARIIQKLGFDVKFKDFKIQNMVAAFDFTFPLDLTRLAYSRYSKYSLYEPELFPGLIYRMKQSKIMVAVFSSGRIAIAGAQNRDEISRAFNIIYPILKSFRIVK